MSRSLLALIAFIGCAGSTTYWEPIPGADAAPFEQADGACRGLSSPALGNLRNPTNTALALGLSKRQYSGCMYSYGWRQATD